MSDAKTTRIIKLRLLLLAEEGKRDAEWHRLNKLLSDTRRAANRIVSTAYLGDEQVALICKWRKAETKEEKLKVRDEFYSKAGMFGKQLDSLCEAVVQAEFPDLPSCITNRLKYEAYGLYRRELLDVRKGERSLRTYKKGMCVPIHQRSIRFAPDERGHHVIWSLGRKGQPFTFAVVYGADRAGFREQVQRIITGELAWGAPSIQRRKRDGKLFLNVPVKDPVTDVQLRPDLSVGVDVGFATLVYAAVSQGPQRTHWGSQDEYMDFRRRIQGRKRRLQQYAAGSRGGHGRKRKLKAADAVEDKEQRFIRSYNHAASKRVVDFALQHRAGTIKMEDLAGIKDPEKNAFLYRNWRYGDLQVMIENKAKRHGIRVLYLDPAYTSQTCSKCGNTDKTQRQGAEFRCAACGERFHADYNAAVNIARSDRVATAKQHGRVPEHPESTLATE